MLKIKTNKQRVEDIMNTIDEYINSYEEMADRNMDMVKACTHEENKVFHAKETEKCLDIALALKDLKHYINSNCL